VLKAEILLGSLVLLCGQVVLWRRRDNIFGYLQAGLFFASILVPILGTTIVDDSDPAIVGLYAHILIVGAAGYLGGVLYGGLIGGSQRLPNVTFSRPFGATIPPLLVRRARITAVLAIGSLLLSFGLLGYIPFFAADRVGAKYGIGVYKAGLDRGALVFHIALAMGSTVLPVVLALVMRHRKGIDVVLAATLGIALVLTLSRGSAFLGPLVFVIALLISRGWKAWQILALVCLCYVSATLVNELVQVTTPVTSASFATKVAASAPDLSDHLGFLNGFRVSGSKEVGLRTIIAGISLNKGDYNPSSYALRIRTGLVDSSEFASGGLRLPAPIWGYASYGYLGVVLWSFASGLFIGWGTALVRRLLTPVYGESGSVLHLILGWIFFQGTFVLLGNFFFPERVAVVSIGIALALCWHRTARIDRVGDPEDTSGVPHAAQARA
jgi:hypothetical protein